MKFYNSDEALLPYQSEVNTNNGFEVLGMYRDKKYRKNIVVKCNTCSKDKELFGDGIFVVESRSMVKGRNPCGCSPRPSWEEWQYEVLMKRKATVNGYDFLGWDGNYNGVNTKVKIGCGEHGSWSSTSIHEYNKYDPICIHCDSYRVGRNRSPDELMITGFMKSGGFSEGTEFKRSENKSKNGFREYWDVLCPDCGDEYTSLYKSLSSGSRGCSCSNYRQKFLYLMTIKDECGETELGAKFGIANNPEERLKGLKRKTKLIIDLIHTWEFDKIQDCKDSERFISQNFDTGFFSREDLPDGWTETISPLDIIPVFHYLESLNNTRLDY